MPEISIQPYVEIFLPVPLVYGRMEIKMKNMNFKKFAIGVLALILAALVLLGAVTAVIDPFFHYHAPLKGLQYEIYYERYQNDGILKHFDYDAVITGNSMCENFKTTEFDALFGVNAVKVPYSGASAKELDMSNRTALAANPELRMLVMGLDYDNLLSDKDTMSYDADDYPTFLYDSNPFNDAKYLFNKSILHSSLNVIKYTRAGGVTTSFDDYALWDTPDTIYGRDMILFQYERPAAVNTMYRLSPEQREMVRGNVEQNIIETARAYPDTQFYLFFPTFSMYYWDKQNQTGTLVQRLEAERETIELLLGCDNVRLFSFLDDFELANDFDRYKDYIHNDSRANSYILQCMAAGEHELTRENYEDYCQRVYDYYTGYDYASLFE